MTLTRRILLAVVVGVLLTLLLVWLADLANEAGYEDLSGALFWQNSILQSHAPLPDIGTAEHPLYDGTLGVMAFLLSFLVGFIVYGVGTFVLVTRWSERQARSP